MGKFALVDMDQAVGVGDWMLKLRQALFDAVKEADVKEIAEGLVKRAKEGDMAATRLLLTYVAGGAQPTIKINKAMVVNGNGHARGRPPKALAAVNHALIRKLLQGDRLGKTMMGLFTIAQRDLPRLNQAAFFRSIDSMLRRGELTRDDDRILLAARN